MNDRCEWCEKVFTIDELRENILIDDDGLLDICEECYLVLESSGDIYFLDTSVDGLIYNDNII